MNLKIFRQSPGVVTLGVGEEEPIPVLQHPELFRNKITECWAQN